MLPILLFCNGLGLLIATGWAIRVGQGPVAAIVGVFAGFWITFPALVLGIAYGWWGMAATGPGAVGAQAAFLLSWFVGIVMLKLASLRLPAVFTLLLVLVDAALAVVFFGVVAASKLLLLIGGILVFSFALVGVYRLFDATGFSLGAKPLPMGRPVLAGRGSGS